MKITRVELGENLKPPSLTRLMQSGEPPSQAWFAFLPSGACLHPDFDRILSESVNSRPDVGIFYFDEVSDLGTGALEQLRKPSFNEVLLWSTDYIGFALALRGDVLGKLGGSDDDQADFGVALPDASALCGPGSRSPAHSGAPHGA